jgi:hypothetical protein
MEEFLKEYIFAEKGFKEKGHIQSRWKASI